MRVKRRILIKMVKESNVLTENEKKDLITKTNIEYLLNSYKKILEMPFVLLKIFLVLGDILVWLGELFQTVGATFNQIIRRIENGKAIVLTDNEAREKVLKEIKQKQQIKLNENDLKKF